MSSKLQVLALAAGLLLPVAAFADAPSVNNGQSGYFNAPDAPLVAPDANNTGSAATTLSRQQSSGYYGTADAPLEAPTAADAEDASQTLEKQRASGYFPDAGAPLETPNANDR